MGDFVATNNDAITQERLQRRLEGYRKHHSESKIHYDNYANVEYEKIKEDTKVLYQKWLEGKNKKTKAKPSKSEVHKEVNQMKPKPKVNAVKPMVINPVAPDRSTESAFSIAGTKSNVTACNESQKQQQPYLNAANPSGGSVQVNINLDANLAQSQNGITVRFSSRIMGNNVHAPADGKTACNANSGCDNNGNLQSCKAESNDLSPSDVTSIVDGTNIIDNSELDNLLGSGPVDDGPIDFEFFNGLEDSNESFSHIADSLLPPACEGSCALNDMATGRSMLPGPTPESNFQQKTLYPNQTSVPNIQTPQNFSRIELNISSDMSKFSSILGETPGPAAETLKHLAAKHNSQEKVQQQMLHSTDMYSMKQFSSQGCYPVQHMQSANSGCAVGVNNFRLSYSASQCQSMGLESQSSGMIDGMKGKTPPCYQEVKSMFPQKLQAQVQRTNVQFIGQKPNIVNSMKEGDVNMEMKYDFEQCRLPQESQAHAGVLSHGQNMGKVYPNCIASQASSIDCLRMQHQKPIIQGYQRYHPYSYQSHYRFANANSNAVVPSNFIQGQNENDFLAYRMSMNTRQQLYMQQQQQQQTCAVFNHNPVGLMNSSQSIQSASGAKDAGLDEFKLGSGGMIPGRYSVSVNSPMVEGPSCHSSINSQNVLINSQDLFYNEGHHPPMHQNFPHATPMPQMRNKWSNVMPTNQQSANKGALSHLPTNYQDANQPLRQNCFQDVRTFAPNGNHSNPPYQFHCNTLQPNGSFFHPNLDDIRTMQYNRSDHGNIQQVATGPIMFDPQKRPVQTMMHQGPRMESFGYSC